MSTQNRIIGVSGKMGSGKDTVANMLIEQIKAQYEVSMLHRKFAFKLKRMLGQGIFGSSCPDDLFESQAFKEKTCALNLNKPLTNRGLLQTFAQAVRDKIPDFWVSLLMRECDIVSPVNWVISDVRYLNEVSAIRDRGGIVFRVVRDTALSDGHISEIELDNCDESFFDSVIYNDGSLQQLSYRVEAELQKHSVKLCLG